MHRRTMIGGLLATPLLLRAQASFAQSLPADVASSLAPKGPLRVAINYGNAVLAQRDAKTGKLSGVSVDIAEELGRRTGLAITLVPFDAAGKVSAAASNDQWDVAFLAGDPERAKEINFTPPYVVIYGTYAVRKDSAFATLADVDHDGVRVAVSRNSIYDLFLTRSLKHATLVRAGSPPESTVMFESEKLEVCAGVQAAMQHLIGSDARLRMIPEPFMQINQAMGVPAGRTAAAAYLKAFVESIKANGFVARTLAKNGQADASVAPPA